MVTKNVDTSMTMRRQAAKDHLRAGLNRQSMCLKLCALGRKKNTFHSNHRVSSEHNQKESEEIIRQRHGELRLQRTQGNFRAIQQRHTRKP